MVSGNFCYLFGRCAKEPMKILQAEDKWTAPITQQRKASQRVEHSLGEATQHNATKRSCRGYHLGKNTVTSCWWNSFQFVAPDLLRN